MHNREIGMKRSCVEPRNNIFTIKVIVNGSKINKLPEAQSKAVSCFLVMAQHMFVDKTTAQHIFADQA
jgi:hypothetical protein